MNLKLVNDRQLEIMLNSLADYARHQTEGATQFDGKLDALPEDMQDIPQLMRNEGAEAEKMRAEVATELHIRGRIACELAHPNHKICPWGVDA